MTSGKLYFLAENYDDAPPLVSGCFDRYDEPGANYCDCLCISKLFIDTLCADAFIK